MVEEFWTESSKYEQINHSSTVLQRTVPTLLVVSPWYRDSLEQSTFYFLTLVSSVTYTDLVILNQHSLQ